MVPILMRQGGPRSVIRRPSTGRYEKLIRELAISQFNLDSGKHDQLAIIVYALNAVIDFINSDPLAFSTGVSNPLSMILNALHDIRRGGRPGLLFERPRSPGRPTDQAFDAIKAAAAMGVEVLLQFMKRAEAGSYVALQAKQLGLRRPDRKQITAGAILSWRDEIEVSKSLLGAKLFRDLKAARQARRPPRSLGEAQALVRELLVQVRFAGFSVGDGDRETY
ncbi:MAG TPA: hypothetical protein PLD10_26030 [Rhodopila sp.]|nr:hypothetical protein [Rhodopila sp.]